jgi:hypothetical protein
MGTGAVVCVVVALVALLVAVPRVVEFFRMTSTRRVFVPRAYRRRRIHILTLETRAIRVLEAHDRSLRDYAARHGYRYTSLRAYAPAGPALPVYMRKLQLMLEALDGGYEFVVWMDSDTLVSHPDVALETALRLDERGDAHVYIGRDYPALSSLWGGVTYNAGVFALRCSAVSAAFLRACIETYKANPACVRDGAFVAAGRWAGECYEQGVMNRLLNGAYSHVVAELPLSVVANSSFALPAAVIVHAYGESKQHEAFERRLLELGVP